MTMVTVNRNDATGTQGLRCRQERLLAAIGRMGKTRKRLKATPTLKGVLPG